MCAGGDLSLFFSLSTIFTLLLYDMEPNRQFITYITVINQIILIPINIALVCLFFVFVFL